MKLVNLTPHAINLLGFSEFPPSGLIARVEETSLVVEHHELPLKKKTFGQVINLPAQEEGTYYIVSALTAQAAWAEGRLDVVCPGDPVRDSEGKIVGCSCLCVSPDF